jgi:hypothetical protein
VAVAILLKLRVYEVMELYEVESVLNLFEDETLREVALTILCLESGFRD